MLNLNLQANAGTGAPVDRQCRGSAMQGAVLSNLVPSDDTSGPDEPFPPPNGGPVRPSWLYRTG